MLIAKVEQVPYTVAGFGDALTHDFAAGVPRARDFFPSQSYDDVINQIDKSVYPREKLCARLEQRAKEIGASPAVFDSIKLLREPNSYVIATGQQAGLLGGPLLTLYKALTAIKLARKLQQESGGRRKFVPVFWIAADDHDLAEIDHTELIDRRTELVRLRAELTADSSSRAAADAFVDAASLQKMKDELQRVQPELAAAAEVYAGHSLSDAFAKLMNRWLGALGLIVVSSVDIREFGGEMLRREIAMFEQTSAAIFRAAENMQRFGYKPGFAEQRTAPHFFIHTEPHGIRASLESVRTGGGIAFRERSGAFESRGYTPREYSPAQLADLIERQPQRFSVGAALRPVLQQLVFPVAAAVLGPGEISYWAQLKEVHAQFGAVWPVIVPRASLTLLDAKTEHTMSKSGLSLEQIFSDYDMLKKSIFSGNQVLQRLSQQKTAVLAEIDRMAAEVNPVDRGLKPLFEKSRARIEHELARILEKTGASLEQRENAGVERLRALANLTRPRNAPQERKLNVAQFMARYPSLAAELLETIDPDLRAHQVVVLS